MDRFPVVRDIAERCLATFVMTLLALATADGVQWTDWTNLSNWRTWAISAVAAVFSLIKGLVASRVVGGRGGGRSASLDPAVQLAPVTADEPGRHWK